MAVLTVTAKGQVTLRKDILQHLGVQPGARISVHKLPNGRIEVEAERSEGKMAAFCGSLKRDGQRTVTIEEMNEVIAKGWTGTS